MARGFERFICTIKALLQRKKQPLIFPLHSVVWDYAVLPVWASSCLSQEPRDFPFSYHDNRHTLKDISVFSHVSMRRKSGHHEMFRAITTLHLERKPHLLRVVFVYFRVWDAGSILIITDSTSPISACAMMELKTAPERRGGTWRSARLTLWRRRRQLLVQPAPDGSPATTSRSLQRQLWHKRENGSCGLDETALTPRWRCSRCQLPTTQLLPSPKILRWLRH